MALRRQVEIDNELLGGYRELNKINESEIAQLKELAGLNNKDRANSNNHRQIK